MVSGIDWTLEKRTAEGDCLDHRDLLAGEEHWDEYQEAAMETAPQNHLLRVAILGHLPEKAPPQTGWEQTFLREW